MKKKYIYIILVLMVIGFASISTVLFIDGGIKIGYQSDDFDVYFSKVYENDVENNKLIVDDNNINFEYELKTKNDSNKIEYFITNGSTMYDANVNISCTGSSEYLDISNDWVNGEVIEAQETKSGLLIINLKKAYAGDSVLTENIECTITAQPIKRNSIIPIINKDNSISGIVKKDDGTNIETLTGGNLVFFSESKKISNISSTGKFRISGLDNGKHEVYYLGDIDPSELEKEIIEKEAIAYGVFRTDVISEELILKCNDGKCNNGEKFVLEEISVFDSPEYQIDLIGDNINLPNNNLSGKFCNSIEVNVEPEFDYYLDSITCSNGFIADYESGVNATNAQTIRIVFPEEQLNTTCSVITKPLTCENNVGKSWLFDYTGTEQNFVVPCSGLYKLETWGAQGTTANKYGSYSVGTMRLLRNQSIYINSGGQGTTSTTGYNGDTIGGGGYSHIATLPGVLNSFTGNYDKLLISAGGAGTTGYIGNSLLKDKEMYCYNCTANEDENNKVVSTTCVSSPATASCTKQGNGYAKIMYLGKTSSGIGILGTPSGYGGSNGGSWVNIPEGSEYLLVNVDGTFVRNCEIVNCNGVGYNCSSSSAYAFVSFYNDAGTQIGSTNTFGSNVSNYRINIPAEATRAKFQTQYSSNKDMNNCYMEISSSTNSRITAIFYGPSAEAGSIIGTISGSSGITDIPKETNFMMVNVRGTSNGTVKQFNCNGLHNVYCNVNANAYVEFYDDNNVKVGNTITYSTDKTNLRLEVPEGATKIRVSNEYKKTTVDPDMCYIDKFSCDTTSSISVSFHGDI